MDNNSAQNPQDDGFSLMYGQPFGSPPKSNDNTTSDVKADKPEVKVEKKTTTLPYTPPVPKDEPKPAKSWSPAQPPRSGTRRGKTIFGGKKTTEPTPEEPQKEEVSVMEPEIAQTDESIVVPPTSPVFPSDDTTTTDGPVQDDSTQTQDSAKGGSASGGDKPVEEKVIIEEPVVSEEPTLLTPSVTPTEPPVTTPTAPPVTTSVNDIPTDDVTNIQPVQPQTEEQIITEENSVFTPSTTPTIPPVTTPVNDIPTDDVTNIQPVQPQDDPISNDKPLPQDGEPQSIEQALGFENIPKEETPVPAPEKQPTGPVPLPTDITEEKPIEIPEAPALSEIEKELTPDVPSQDLPTEPKVTIKDKLLSQEETPIEGYPEPTTPPEPVLPDQSIVTPTQESQVPPVLQPEIEPTQTEPIQPEPLVPPVQDEIPQQEQPLTQEPIQPVTPEPQQEVLAETEISTTTPQPPIEPETPVTTPQQQPIEPVTEPPQQPVDQPDPSQSVLDSFVKTPEQPVTEVKPEQPKPETKVITPDEKGIPSPKSQKKLKGLNKSLKFATIVGVLFLIVAIALVSIPSLPYIWYRISNSATTSETDSISEPATGTDSGSFSDVIDTTSNGEDIELPKFDATLPYYNTLIISDIGVNGVIHEGDDPQGSLEDGVWRVGDFGTPEDSNSIILAAHRFGYITWTSEFRTENSFYNLNKTEVNDIIEIVWNQRKYEYKITKVEEGTTINDYESDLILYTCKLFNTPVRIFRYAERTN